MADTGRKVEHEITADNSGFVRALTGAATAAQDSAGKIDSAFTKVQAVFGRANAALLALAAAVAGGAFFKAAIDETNKFTGEVTKLSRTMQITVEDAATLNTALGDIGADANTYTDAFAKFATQLRKNEEGVQAMGVKTRDANGNLRDTNELFRDALGVVGRYKPGIDQTTAAMNLFGKSVDEVQTLQKLTNQRLEEARIKNEELGLTVTKEGVEASRRYKAAMNDVGDVLLAVKKVIGDAVMPIFAQLGEWFSSIGPQVVMAFRVAIFGLVAVFRVVEGAVKTMAGIVYEAFKLIVDGAGMLGEVFAKLLSGDFAGAYEAAKALGARTGEAFSNAFAKFVTAGDEVDKAIKADFDRTFGKGTAAGIAGPTGGTQRMGALKVGSEATPKSQMQAWETELSERKLKLQETANAEGTFAQMSKAQEEAFWREKLAITQRGSADNLSVRKRVADLELEQNKERFQTLIAQLQAQQAQYKSNTEARLLLLQSEAQMVKAKFGEESKEYEDVQKRIVEAKRQAADQIRQIEQERAQANLLARQAELDAEAQRNQMDRQLRLINAQEALRIDQSIEQRRFALAQQALQDRINAAMAVEDVNTVEVEKLNLEREQLEREHQQRMGQIRAQAAADASRYQLQALQSIESGWASVLARGMQGAMSLQSMGRAMLQATYNAVTQMLGQMAARWMTEQAVQLLTGKATALGKIQAEAATAGAAAIASTAAIPIVGPSMAPAAGAAAYGAAMAFAPLAVASAFGGYDIAAGVNPLTQLHEKEMVLPAKYAEPLREQLEDGDGRGATHHWHIQALDGESVRRVLMENAEHVFDAAKSATRGGRR